MSTASDEKTVLELTDKLMTFISDELVDNWFRAFEDWYYNHPDIAELRGLYNTGLSLFGLLQDRHPLDCDELQESLALFREAYVEQTNQSKL